MREDPALNGAEMRIGPTACFCNVLLVLGSISGNGPWVRLKPALNGFRRENEQTIPSFMASDTPQYLRSKEDVKLFVCDKSVLLKKPIVVVKSEYRRFLVACPEPGCSFSLKFYQRIDGVFTSLNPSPIPATPSFPLSDVFGSSPRVWKSSAKIPQFLFRGCAI